jgi:6-phosphogluconolactonase
MRLRNILGILLLASASLLAQKPGTLRVFIGTYTGGESKGIYTCELSTADGSIENLNLAAETPSPSFLAISPNKKFLYSVNEVSDFNGEKAGSVTAYKIDGASLVKINAQSTVGDGPCYISVDRTGKHALVANYGSGSIAVLPIRADGSLEPHSAFVQHTGSSVNPERQKEPHAHSLNMDPGNHFAIAADLGLDKLLVYRLDQEAGTLTPNDPPFVQIPPGSGPRHLSFTPNHRFAYVNGEMGNNVVALSWNGEKGAFKVLQSISTLPEGWRGTSWTAQTEVHPNGKFLYVSNRGHDSIAVFRIDRSGRLSYVENESTGGKTPRNFEIAPGGKFLVAANQDSDSLVVFRIDQNSGALTPAGHQIHAPKPVCVKFLAP